MTGIRQPQVTVGHAGAGAAMLQLNQSAIPARQPRVTVGQAGVGSAMLQLAMLQLSR